MISIGKKLFFTRKITNHYKALVTIAVALASVLIVNAVVIGTDGSHIALARHHDNTNQRQACEAAGGISPISDSCTTASSSNTITQCTPLSPPSSSTPTTHPTVLTLMASPQIVSAKGV